MAREAMARLKSTGAGGASVGARRRGGSGWGWPLGGRRGRGGDGGRQPQQRARRASTTSQPDRTDGHLVATARMRGRPEFQLRLRLSPGSHLSYHFASFGVHGRPRSCPVAAILAPAEDELLVAGAVELEAPEPGRAGRGPRAYGRSPPAPGLLDLAVEVALVELLAEDLLVDVLQLQDREQLGQQLEGQRGVLQLRAQPASGDARICSWSKASSRGQRAAPGTSARRGSPRSRAGSARRSAPARCRPR